VPTDVVHVDEVTGLVYTRMDRSGLYGHLTTCAGPAPTVPTRSTEVAKIVPSVPLGELAGRIHLMLDNRAYVATGGSRACTMCGTTGTDCMTALANSTPCCGACGEGNTHPAPGESKGTCAEWSAAREAQA